MRQAKLKLFFVLAVFMCLGFMMGCAGMEYDPSWGGILPSEFPNADRAIDKADMAGKDSQCPNEFAKAQKMRDKAYDLYSQCNKEEALKAARQAKAMAEDLCSGQPKVIDKLTLYIHFDTDKSIIKENDFGKMNEAIEFIKKYPGTTIIIKGHTDSVAEEAYNQALSLRRAQAAKQYFVEKGGIAASRMKVEGYGELMPVESNDTPWGRAQNRRVEVLISE